MVMVVPFLGTQLPIFSLICFHSYHSSSLFYDSQYVFNNCTFDKNSATYGGALCIYTDISSYNQYIKIYMYNSIFSDNFSQSSSGAIYSTSSIFVAENCSFVRNIGGPYSLHNITAYGGKLFFIIYLKRNRTEKDYFLK